MPASDHQWDKPAAMAIPESGFLVLEEGRYGPIFPRTPACYGFSVIGKVKEGREQAIRDYGKEIEAAVAADPKVLAPLQLHCLRLLTCDDASCLTRCHRAFVSNPCHFFRTPLPIPWRHIRSLRDADQTRSEGSVT